MTTKTTKPVNYLNNRDLLKQIHQSKNTYCSYTDPSYHQYDLIVNLPEVPVSEALATITDEQIEAAKVAKAARLSADTGTRVAPESIDSAGLVFRIMTWDHIPVVSQKESKESTKRANSKKKSAKEIIELNFEDPDEDGFGDIEDPTVADVDDHVHAKVNFPPFQHYLLQADGTLVCVGKSHWTGPVEGGQFSKDHGRVTERLGWMYKTLTERYASKYNWRGYTYNDEMQGAALLQLSYVGLRFNEARSQNPFTYYTTTITNAFCRVLNAEKKMRRIRDDILEMNNMSPSWTRQNENADKDYHG